MLEIALGRTRGDHRQDHAVVGSGTLDGVRIGWVSAIGIAASTGAPDQLQHAVIRACREQRLVEAAGGHRIGNALMVPPERLVRGTSQIDLLRRESGGGEGDRRRLEQQPCCAHLLDVVCAGSVTPNGSVRHRLRAETCVPGAVQHRRLERTGHRHKAVAEHE